MADRQGWTGIGFMHVGKKGSTSGVHLPRWQHWQMLLHQRVRASNSTLLTACAAKHVSRLTLTQ